MLADTRSWHCWHTKLHESWHCCEKNKLCIINKPISHSVESNSILHPQRNCTSHDNRNEYFTADNIRQISLARTKRLALKRKVKRSSCHFNGPQWPSMRLCWYSPALSTLLYTIHGLLCHSSSAISLSQMLADTRSWHCWHTKLHESWHCCEKNKLCIINKPISHSVESNSILHPQRNCTSHDNRNEYFTADNIRQISLARTKRLALKRKVKRSSCRFNGPQWPSMRLCW